ncbi:MAG TPA: TonB-dependent receptor [Phenylobacterium sp.]|uniref:TonB-dependent receptor n=1 Tax=Phenylobacterium sp. TaxID=1871053 RepID=UPI002CFE9CF3|nr:TonB-dependent receptor [Phenylobacterium sp.]HSV02647.1 TonB-dependent receptor [Phenylobacterium sp.]
MCASAIAGFWAGQAMAAAPSPPANTIEQLIVTAEKREESAQNVPIALTALSGAALERQGVIGFENLSTRVPSLRFGPGVTGGENVITLRGIGSQNTTSGGDSPVAYNLDGVYLARTTSVDTEFFDIDRIEVLRGPQGTLYGRNSVGGSVNVITNHPTDTLDGHVDALFGNYGAQTYRAWANAPLYDNGDQQVLARIAVVRAEHDPYQKNLFNGQGAPHNGDAQDFWLARGELYFKLSDKANLLLIGSNSWNGDPVATKTQWWEAPGRFVGAQPFLTDPREVRKNSPEMYGNNNYYASATFNYDLGFATFTSVTGFAASKWKESSDADGSELTIALNPLWTLRQFQESEEVRLASNPSSQPLSWIVGGFVFREKAHQDFLFIDTGLNDPAALFDAFVFRNGGDFRTLSWAPFGQVDYDLAKTSLAVPLTLTLGLRYTRDTKKGADFLDFALPLVGLDFPQAKTFDRSWTQTTGKIGLAYRPSEELMLYANASKGYLSGGGLVGNFPGIYQPEKVNAYEAGFKSTWLERRLQLNGAIYREDIKDMQVFVQDITGSRIDNAGRAHINGLELEAVATPLDGLSLNASATFTDAKYDQYVTINNRFSGPAPGCDPVTRLCNFAGHRLVQTPRYTYDLGAQYVWEASFGQVTPRIDVFHSGDLFFLSANSPLERQKPYTLVDANVTWRSPDKRFTVEIFGRNLGDETVISNDGLQSNTIGEGFAPDNFSYFPPRTYGVRFGVDF